MLNSGPYRPFLLRRWLIPLMLILFSCFAATAVNAQNTKGDRPVNSARPAGKRLENQGSRKKQTLFSGKSRTAQKTSTKKRKTIQSTPKRDTPDRGLNSTSTGSGASGDSPYRGNRTASGKRIVNRSSESRSVNIYPRQKEQRNPPQENARRASSVPLPSSGKGLREPVRKDVAYRGPAASGRPVISRKQQTKPSKFYPAKGPYVQRSAPEKSMRQVAGVPLKTRRLSLINEARKVNRIDVIIKSLTKNYISGGRVNPYAFKVRKPQLPAGSDLTGRPLRRLNYQSPGIDFVSSDTLKQANRRPKSDKGSAENRSQVRSASSTGNAWSGDITGKKLKTRSTDSKFKRAGGVSGRILSAGVISGQGLPLEKNEKKFGRVKGITGLTGKGNMPARMPMMYSFKSSGINARSGKLFMPGISGNSIARYSGKMRITGPGKFGSGKSNSFNGIRGKQLGILDLNQTAGNRISGMFANQKKLNQKYRGVQNMPVAGTFSSGMRSGKIQSMTNARMKSSRTASVYGFIGQKSSKPLKIGALNKRSFMGSGVVKTKRTTPGFLLGVNQVNVGGIVSKTPVQKKINQGRKKLEFSGRLREWQPASFTGSMGYNGSAAFVRKRNAAVTPKPGIKNYGMAMKQKFHRPTKGNYQFNAHRLTTAQSLQYIFSGARNYGFRLRSLEQKMVAAGRPKIKSSGNSAVGPGGNFRSAKLQIRDKNFSTHPDSKMLLSAGEMGYQGSRYFVTGKSNPKTNKPVRANVSKGGRVMVNPNAGMHRLYVFGKSGIQPKQYNYNRYGFNSPVNISSHQIYTFYRQGRLPGIPDYNRINRQVPLISRYDRARIYINGYQTKPYRIPEMNYSKIIQTGQVKPAKKFLNPKPREPLFVPDYGQQNIVGLYSGNIIQRPHVVPEYMTQKRMRISPWFRPKTPERRVSFEVSRYWLPVPADVNKLMKFTPEHSKSRKPVETAKFSRKVYLDPGYANAGLYPIKKGNRKSSVGYKDQYQTGRVPLFIAPNKGTISAAAYSGNFKIEKPGDRADKTIAGYASTKNKNPFRNQWIRGPMSDPVAIKLHRPDDRAFAADGLQIKFRYRDLVHTPMAVGTALPIRGRSLQARNDLQSLNPAKRQNKYVRSDLASRSALKVQEPNRAFIRTALMQTNIKMNKKEFGGLHPDATFLRDKEQNAAGERSVKTGIKMMWAKLFKKDDYQPASLKAKLKKPRYDSREIGIWYE